MLTTEEMALVRAMVNERVSQAFHDPEREGTWKIEVDASPPPGMSLEMEQFFAVLADEIEQAVNLTMATMIAALRPGPEANGS